MPKQRTLTEESSAVQKSGKLESLGSNVMSGQSIQMKKPLAQGHPDQEQASTKFPQIGNGKNIQVNSSAGADPSRLRSNITPKVITQKESKEPTKGNIWIVKPGENTNRGNGISVCSKLREIKNIVS